MNAVNLIPGAQGGRRALSTSPQTLALLVGLAMVLIGALLYVSAANKVTARKSELARATASALTWKTVANAFAPYVTESQQRATKIAGVRTLAASRFPWPQLLVQIARLMPATAGLSSLQARAAAASGTLASTLPGVQLSGCAASQSTVAQAMQQLRRVDGVSDVVLSSSSDSGSGAAAAGSAPNAGGASSGDGCTYPVQFQISLAIAGPPSAAPAATSTKPAAQ